jgi:hypothetical protein
MRTFTQIADIQALVVGVVFAWAGVWKTFFPQARRAAQQSALAKILPTPGLAQAAHIAVGVSEIIVAALLLAPPQRWWAPRLASILAVGFLAYLALAWKVAPEKTCACMGGRAIPISRRSVARAVGILALTVVAWPAETYWGVSLVAAPWLLALALAELLAVWLLSPEFDGPSVLIRRRMARAARMRLDPTCAHVTVDWTQLDTELRRTRQFNTFARYISGPSDRWREQCTGFIAFTAVYKSQPATAIFTFPMRFEASEVAAALLDDASNEVVARLAPLRHEVRH